MCEAVGYPSHVQGQKVTVHLTVERCKYCKAKLLKIYARLKLLYSLMDAAWGDQKYEEPKSNRIKYGTVPHIDLEFFGLGRKYTPLDTLLSR